MPAKSIPAGSRTADYAMAGVFLLGCLAVALAMLACLGMAGFAIYRTTQRNTDRPATARDGSCRIMLPLGWIELEAKGVILLQAGIPSDQATFTVTRVAKVDVAPGLTYRDEGRQAVHRLQVSPEFENMKILRGPDDRVVNNRAAVRYELEGISKAMGRRFIYIVTCVDGERSIFHLMTTVVPSEVDRYREPGEKMVASFEELP